ncbi:MAG: CRTAC1 family protein [Acidobacteriota bacterium]
MTEMASFSLRLLATAIALTLLAPADRAAGGEPLFTDVTAASGLDFVHFNGMTGDLLFPEIAGSGGALFDFDGDGDLDAYLVQGSLLTREAKLEDALIAPRGALTDRLLRNDPGPRGTPRFTDVTKASGLEAEDYGMGVAAGDYDNDGDIDLYVANLGSNRLWRNRGDGTFEDVTTASGSDDDRWSIGASFADFDGDGWLDLFVVNYVRFDVERNVRCFEKSSRLDYCGPAAFDAEADRLLRNRGDGTFEDVSLTSGIGRQKGAGLGVATADFNGDGRLDFYVANDGMLNFLWTNRGDGTFEEDALFAGIAVNRNGKAEASMGVDAGDFDGDGDADLFMTHLMGETNTLYINDGSGLFEDRTVEMGLGESSLPFTSFGTAWFDADLDGRLDLVIANGAVSFTDRRPGPETPYPLEQPNQFFRQRSDGRFEDASAEAGKAFLGPEVSRGLALGDLDNDGDGDLLLINNSGPARVLLNRWGDDRPWLGLRLVTGERDAFGARVELLAAADEAATKNPKKSRWGRVRSDGSYASAHDPRVVFGLGDDFQPQSVRVYWPDGSQETWPAPPLGRYTSLVQGASTPSPAESKQGEPGEPPPAEERTP